MARKAAGNSAKGNKSGNKKATASQKQAQGIESGVLMLAEQLGWLVGTVQKKTDGLLDNDMLQQQVTQIRDGAAELLKQVNRAGMAAGQSATKMASAAKSALPAMPAMPALPSLPGTKAKKAAAAKQAAADAKRAQSRQPVAAPGKKHRKPPPQQKTWSHMSDPAVKLKGRKDVFSAKVRGGARGVRS